MKKISWSILGLTLLLSPALYADAGIQPNKQNIAATRQCPGSCPVTTSSSSNSSNSSNCNSCNPCQECNTDTDCATCCLTPVRTTIHPRSQGANTARELVGWQWYINVPGMCENYSAAYAAYEYQRTFKPEGLAEQLFGGTELAFQGSAVPNRSSNALVADNFGLSREFVGTARFCPRIESHIIDFGFYHGLDCWMENLYIRLHAPVAITRWRLCPDFNVTQVGNNFPPCYVNSTSQTPASQDNITNNNAGTPTAQTLQEALSGTFKFGDMQTDWGAGRFNFCQKSRSGLADIDVIVGYNFHNNDCSHFGFYAQLVLPTGTRRTDKFFFAPVAGNGRHLEVGGGVSAHSVFYSREESCLAFFLEGNVTHMFKSRQCRLFDFCKNGAFSRYLLLKEFDDTSGNPVYNGNLINAASFNNRSVHVKLNVKADASFKFAWRWCNLAADLGYNIYAHSKEDIIDLCGDDACCTFDGRNFGIKGTECVCCFNYPVICLTTGAQSDPCTDGTSQLCAQGTTCSVNQGFCGETVVTQCDGTQTINVTAERNNTTQPNATAFQVQQHSGQIGTDDCTVALSCLSNQVTSGCTNLDTIVDNTSFVSCRNITPTQFVSIGDFNVKSAEAPSLVTHKIFGYFGYGWQCCGYEPTIGIGAEAEFEAKETGDTSCSRNGLDQWGVFVKGTIAW